MIIISSSSIVVVVDVVVITIIPSLGLDLTDPGTKLHFRFVFCTLRRLRNLFCANFHAVISTRKAQNGSTQPTNQFVALVEFLQTFARA